MHKQVYNEQDTSQCLFWVATVLWEFFFFFFFFNQLKCVLKIYLRELTHIT